LNIASNRYKFDPKPHVTKVAVAAAAAAAAIMQPQQNAQVHGKFYWPNQTNAEARIPVQITQVSAFAATISLCRLACFRVSCVAFS
jgi:hypothetical protein